MFASKPAVDVVMLRVAASLLLAACCMHKRQSAIDDDFDVISIHIQRLLTACRRSYGECKSEQQQKWL